MQGFGYLNWNLVGFLAISWFVVFLILAKGRSLHLLTTAFTNIKPHFRYKKFWKSIIRTRDPTLYRFEYNSYQSSYAARLYERNQAVFHTEMGKTNRTKCMVCCCNSSLLFIERLFRQCYNVSAHITFSFLIYLEVGKFNEFFVNLLTGIHHITSFDITFIGMRISFQLWTLLQVF